MVLIFSVNVLIKGSRCLSTSFAFLRTLRYILHRGDELVTPLFLRSLYACADNDSLSEHLIPSNVGVPWIVDCVVIEDASQASNWVGLDIGAVDDIISGRAGVISFAF